MTRRFTSSSLRSSPCLLLLLTGLAVWHLQTLSRQLRWKQRDAWQADAPAGVAIRKNATRSSSSSRQHKSTVAGARIKQLSLQQGPKTTVLADLCPDSGRRRHGLVAVPNATASCQGKEEYLELLRNAVVTTGGGVAAENNASDQNLYCACPLLPTKQQVAALYGPEPVVIGLERCRDYRTMLALNGTDIEPRVRVAGLFNTGTTAFSYLLELNLEALNDNGRGNIPTLHEVPWGKHVPAYLRLNNTFPRDNPEGSNRHLVLPVVLIRDPYWWMQSMCKEPYNVQWHRPRDHCPNLVVTEPDRRQNPLLFRRMHTYEVDVSWDMAYYNYTDYYDSLADLWSTWYREYYDLPADYPRLLIRFEDTLFHAPRIMELIAECVGMSANQPFRHRLRPAKYHGKPSDLVTALSKYGGSTLGRSEGLTAQDLDHAAHGALDPKLMRIFGYQHPESVLD